MYAKYHCHPYILSTTVLSDMHCLYMKIKHMIGTQNAHNAHAYTLYMHAHVQGVYITRTHVEIKSTYMNTNTYESVLYIHVHLELNQNSMIVISVASILGL